MDGELDGAQGAGVEWQGLQGDETHVNEQSEQQEAQQIDGVGSNGGDAAGEVADIVTKADAEYRASLADRNKKSRS